VIFHLFAQIVPLSLALLLEFSALKHYSIFTMFLFSAWMPLTSSSHFLPFGLRPFLTELSFYAHSCFALTDLAPCICAAVLFRKSRSVSFPSRSFEENLG